MIGPAHHSSISEKPKSPIVCSDTSAEGRFLNVITCLLWGNLTLRFCSCIILLTCSAFAAGKVSAPELIRMSQSNAPGFRQALVTSLGTEQIKKGTALLGQGPDFIWAVEVASMPTLVVDRS